MKGDRSYGRVIAREVVLILREAAHHVSVNGI
jgi:hypothetical protein